jgi:hypothetical protein
MIRVGPILQVSILALGAAIAAPARADTVRVALVVGANRGGASTAPLRYAERDAQRFARVLAEVGGVPPDRLLLLSAPTSDELRKGFDRLDALARTARERGADRVVAVFYYSGHSDGINLELGSRDRFPFAEVRTRFERSPAHVRLGFVDSCKSGALTQDKGLTAGPSFDLALSDESDVGGAAFVTSSSASERAQESAEIGGSYFTHFLLSALRGAADADGNGRVTLSEAYQYAFAKTVVETARSIVGPQHPSYAYRLSGRGDLTLADLRQAAATIVLQPGAGGTYVVIDGRRKEMVAEVVKPEREGRRLAVPPGEYVVGRRDGERFLAARVAVATGREATVADADLRAEPIRLALAKGDAVDAANSISAAYSLTGGALGSFTASNEVALAFRREAAEYWYVAIAGGFGFADVDARGLQYRYRSVLGDAAALRGFSLPALRLFAGIGAGASYAWQTLVSGEKQAGLVFRYGAVAALELPVYDAFTIGLRWDLGATAVRLNGELRHRALLRAGIGVGYAF